MSLDPNNARLGTSLVLGVDAPAAPLTVTLPRGTRFDRRAAAPGARVGFGRYVVDVQGFLNPGGTTQLVWALTATLGRQPGSVSLAGTLLGADAAAALLAPMLGTPIPATTATTARFTRSAGRLEFRLGALPAQLAPPAPASATPARLELSLNAGRRVRRTFYHRFRVPTAGGGYRIQRVRDHRLVSYDLLRTPARCASWTYLLRSGQQRSSGSIPCLPPLT